MKKQDLRTLALMGLASGLLFSPSSLLNAAEKQPTSPTKTVSKSADEDDDANDSNMNYHLMTEDELMLELNAKGIAMYKSLSPDGKAMALLTASMMCNNSNPCKGYNACKTAHNDCAGKGNCKGQGKCAYSDKNLAVKVVYDKMAAKRAKANGQQP